MQETRQIVECESESLVLAHIFLELQLGTEWEEDSDSKSSYCAQRTDCVDPVQVDTF